jgi:hypothetical protein
LRNALPNRRSDARDTGARYGNGTPR